MRFYCINYVLFELQRTGTFRYRQVVLQKQLLLYLVHTILRDTRPLGCRELVLSVTDAFLHAG